MPVRIFSFKDVFEDEAEEVRALLRTHNIEFYETPSSKWGLSAGAIWLKDDTVEQQAKMLIENYQAERAARIRREYDQLKKEGRNETVIDRLRRYPLQVLFYLAFALLILYLTIMPFVKLSA